MLQNREIVSFLDDFEELFKAGVIPKERVNDVEKIKLILQ